MEKLNQLSNFAAMKEAAVQAATKAAGQMAGQLTQDRVAALAQKLVSRLNEQIRSAGLDPFTGPSDRTVEFAVPLCACHIPCCGLKGRAKLKDCKAVGLASFACAADDAKVTVDGSSFKANFKFKAGPIEASFCAETQLLVAGCLAACFSIPSEATIVVGCDGISLRVGIEGDFSQKRLALVAAESGLCDGPVMRKPEIRSSASSGGARLKRLACRLATEERQRLVDLFEGQLMETIKVFADDPKALASL